MFRTTLLVLCLLVGVASGVGYPQGHDVSFYFWSCSLSGRLEDGRCCDMSGYTNCPDHCDVHFFVCIREHNETSNYCNENTSSHITFFHYAYLDVHNITFFEGDNVFGVGLDNPLVYSFSGNWSKRVQTVLVARDYDYYDSTGSYKFEHIDYIDVNWTVPAGRAVDRRSYAGVFRNMVVQIGLKIDCWKGWYGDYCTTLCVRRDNSTGHYLCSETGEKECLFGWGGVHCTTGKCYPACPTGSSCNNLTRECTCEAGYAKVGEACECIPHEHCNLIGGFCQLAGECACRKGFNGTNCDWVDICQYRGNPCHNGGACVATGNSSYSCECAPGYQGELCSFMACPNTGCPSLLPCGNNGMCTNTISGVHCMCTKGFVGRCCETQLNFCLANPCAHGSCNNLVGDYSCSCDAGYTGKDCDSPINECALLTPCENGTCYDRIAGYSCVCYNGYSGANCSETCTAPSECDCAHSCVYGACLPSGGVYSCHCLPGYTGMSCDTNIDDCVGYCENGATCTDGIGSAVCHCPAGYAGAKCDTDIDECAFNPCDHGVCVNSDGSYACVCEAAYTGDTCDTFQQLDYCATLDPCLNGGTCHNEPFGSSCECASGYNGTECQDEIDHCQEIVCHNGGACQGGLCLCTVSYAGPACSQPVDVCEDTVAPDDCNGECVNDPSEPGGYRCECYLGYTGDTCHEDIDDCYAGSCENGGNCTDGLNQFFCDCENGYNGERCEIPVDICEGNLCLNGGVCVQEGAGYRCECPEGYVVPYCQKTEECDRHSCNDKGECKRISKQSEALCDCDIGYTGQYCESLIDYCASSPCHYGATCYKGVASYYCRCENNVTGCVDSGEPDGSQLIPGIDNSLTGVTGGAALGVILTLLVVLVLTLLLLGLRYRGKKGRRREGQENSRGRGHRNQLLDSQDSTFINPFFDGTEMYPILDPPSYDTVQYSHYRMEPALYPAVSPLLTKDTKDTYANPSALAMPEKTPL